MNNLLHAMEPWADFWSTSLWRASWQGAIAIAVVWMLARLCMFLSPRVIHWMWRLVCLKLLVALVWVAPIPLAILPPPPPAEFEVTWKGDTVSLKMSKPAKIVRPARIRPTGVTGTASP